MTSIVLILCLLLTGGFAYLPTQEQFQIHNQLQDALFNDTFTLFTLSEVFFPRVGITPVCVPIKYELSCSQSHKYNACFLWTTYNSQSHVGQILLGYAYYGVILTGFDWEKSCWFFSDAVTTVLQLNVSDLECNNYTNFTLQAELQGFTAVVSHNLFMYMYVIMIYAMWHTNKGQDCNALWQSSTLLASPMCFKELLTYVWEVISAKIRSVDTLKQECHSIVFWSIVELLCIDSIVL